MFQTVLSISSFRRSSPAAGNSEWAAFHVIFLINTLTAGALEATQASNHMKMKLKQTTTSPKQNKAKQNPTNKQTMPLIQITKIHLWTCRSVYSYTLNSALWFELSICLWSAEFGALYCIVLKFVAGLVKPWCSNVRVLNYIILLSTLSNFLNAVSHSASGH